MQPDTAEIIRDLADKIETFGAVPFARPEYADAMRAAADQVEATATEIALLTAQRDEARHVVRETLWMAGRYANGRQTYAVQMYNDARKIAEAGGYASKAEPAVDGGNMETTDAA